MKPIVLLMLALVAIETSSASESSEASARAAELVKNSEVLKFMREWKEPTPEELRRRVEKQLTATDAPSHGTFVSQVAGVIVTGSHNADGPSFFIVYKGSLQILAEEIVRRSQTFSAKFSASEWRQAKANMASTIQRLPDEFAHSVSAMWFEGVKSWSSEMELLNLRHAVRDARKRATLVMEICQAFHSVGILPVIPDDRLRQMNDTLLKISSLEQEIDAFIDEQPVTQRYHAGREAIRQRWNSAKQLHTDGAGPGAFFGELSKAAEELDRLQEDLKQPIKIEDDYHRGIALCQQEVVRKKTEKIDEVLRKVATHYRDKYYSQQGRQPGSSSGTSSVSSMSSENVRGGTSFGGSLKEYVGAVAQGVVVGYRLQDRINNSSPAELQAEVNKWMEGGDSQMFSDAEKAYDRLNNATEAIDRWFSKPKK